MWAKQNTAATLIVGPILDSTGAEYTSAVIGDLSISKNGGTLTALASAATLTHIANGQYTLVMTTGNLDTLGRLQITCNKSTYQMPPIGLNIVPADRYDSLVLGTDRFDANVTHVGDTSQTAGDIYASQVAIAGYIDTEVAAIKAKTDQLTFTTANKVDSTAVLDSSSLTAIRDGLATAAAVQSVKDDTGATLPAQNTAIYNRLGVPAGASIAADIAGIESGGGDATLANQQLILDRLSETTIGVTGYAQLDIYGVLQLKRGHTATLTFTSSTSNIVSDLSANTTKVFFGIKDAAGRSWLSIEGTKIVNTGLQSVRFTISAALAAAMINGEHFFDVVAVYGYNASTTPKYTSLEPFTSGRAKVTDLYVDI